MRRSASELDTIIAAPADIAFQRNIKPIAVMSSIHSFRR
jgi:hypothetical protein